MGSLISDILTDLGHLWPWWLSSMLKATVWLAAGALVDRALRPRSSSVRHVVAVLAALGLPLIFILNLSPRPETHGWKPLTPVWEQMAARAQTAETTTGPQLKEVAAASAPQMTEQAVSVRYWAGVVIAMWGTGVLVNWMRLIAGFWPHRKLGRPADQCRDASFVRAMERDCRRLGVAHVPLLRVVPEGVPRLTGVWRPAIELPAAASEWPEEKLSAVLRHELAHVRRADLWWLVGTEGALALVWGHPLGILLRRRLARLREEACDDAVLASGIEPTTYASHLASFLTVSGTPARLLSLPAAERTGWSRRFRRLLDPAVSRHTIRAWEVVGFSLVSGTVVSLGTLFVGCASSRGPQAQEMGALPAEPVLPRKLPSGTRKLSIELRVVETTVRTQEAAKLGFPEGFPTLMGRVLTKDQSRTLFHQGHGEMRFVTPKLTAMPGQELKVESGKPIRYPVEFLPNPRTGVMEPVVYEEKKVGVFLTVAARPTENPDLIHLRFRFELKEHEGTMLYSPPGVTQPVFNMRMASDEIEMLNGSYIVVGFKPATPKLAGFVPEASNEMQHDQWHREAGGEAYGRLAAVQVLVEEAKD